MQLYINILENSFIVFLNNKETIVSLIEMNIKKTSKSINACPLLYIKINKNISLDDDDKYQIQKDQNPQNDLIDKTNYQDEYENNNFQTSATSNNFIFNGKNNNFIYCEKYEEKNEIILTADEEESILQLFVSIRSAFLNNEIISIKDFRFISILGRGNFGKVSLVEYISHPGQFYALKSIKKISIVQKHSIKSVLRERSMLVYNKHPFIVSLKFAFQTATKFYIGMEFISGGDLRNCINKSFGLSSKRNSKIKNEGDDKNNNSKISQNNKYEKSDSVNNDTGEKNENTDNYHTTNDEKSDIDEDSNEIRKSIDDDQIYFSNLNQNHHDINYHITFKDVQIYVAEMALALHYLHSNGVVYRDLKPENIMICEDGHLKLTDFGLALKIGPNGSSRTLCGTLKYIAPEIIKHFKYSFSVDWWSLGIVVYELIFSRTPFNGTSRNQIFGKILNEPLKFPEIKEKCTENINDDKIIKKKLEFTENNLNVLQELELKGFCSGLNGSIVEYSSIKDFIHLLLAKNYKRRLIFGQSFINHPFFGGINFDDIMNKKFKPSFIPSSTIGTENFNDKFTNMEAHDSVAELPVGHKSVCVNGFSFFGSFFENKEEKEENIGNAKDNDNDND